MAGGLGGWGAEALTLKAADGTQRVSSFILPTSQGLHHHWDEGDARSPAGLTVGCFLLCPRHSQSVSSCVGRSDHGEGLHCGDHSNIQGRRLTAFPDGQENVGWAGLGTGDQCGDLSPWRQSGGLSRQEDCVTDRVVSGNTVPVATASNVVVSELVGRATTNGAWGVFGLHPDSEVVLETKSELPVQKVETQGLRGDDGKPVT